MPWVAGIDGCRAGWIVVAVETGRPGAMPVQVILCHRFRDVLAIRPRPAAIAVDIPIGLLDTFQAAGRDCDQAARQLLGRRASSVFTPPTRPLLTAKTYEGVRRYGLSRQSFGILPKLRDVDLIMTPRRQRWIYEAHPELAFLALAGGRPMRFNKKTRAGRNERLRVIESAGAGRIHPIRRHIRRVWRDGLTAFTRKEVAADDLLDACALAWTALRILNGSAQRVPQSPPIDRKGLRMEICY